MRRGGDGDVEMRAKGEVEEKSLERGWMQTDGRRGDENEGGDVGGGELLQSQAERSGGGGVADGVGKGERGEKRVVDGCVVAVGRENDGGDGKGCGGARRRRRRGAEERGGVAGGVRVEEGEKEDCCEQKRERER